MPVTPGPDPVCSVLMLALPLPQPGEVEVGWTKGGVGLVRMEQTDGTGESMGGVGGVVSVGRGPVVSRSPFNCVGGCGSSDEGGKWGNIKRKQKNLTTTILQSDKRLLLHWLPCL